MSNETFALTKEQSDYISELVYDHGFKACEKLDKLLQSLPLITGEPEAWLINFKDTDGNQRSRVYTHDAIGDYRQIDPDATSEELFTHAQPLQPITVDMVTDAMKEQFLKTPNGAARKDVFLAAVNAWIKHKGDTK